MPPPITNLVLGVPHPSSPRKALRLNVSVAELVRRAVDAYVAAEIAPSFEERRRRALEAAGEFGSGKKDAGKSHDDYLAEAYRR
jgi:hypothetical protein